MTGVVAGCAGDSDSATPSSTGTADDRSPAGRPDGSGAGDDGVVASVSVPTTETDYAVMGQADATRATVYGGWKCPYTRQFVRNQLPGIVREYVQSGDLRIEFRAVRFQTGTPYGGDEARATRAGLAVWHERPDDFWPYFARVYATQPPETQEWATVDALTDRMTAVGIERTDPIREAITSGQYRSLWRATMDRVHRLGLEGIPRLALGGEVTAPTLRPAATRRQLETVLG